MLQEQLVDHGDRPAWQRHSELGPNLEPELQTVPALPQEGLVNPPEYDWKGVWQELCQKDKEDLKTWCDVEVITEEEQPSLESVDGFWQGLRTTSTLYSDTTLRSDDLNDDYQLLFVDLLYRHAVNVMDAMESNTRVEPLRLLLLGTAGTGKTRSVKTVLQRIQEEC